MKSGFAGDDGAGGGNRLSAGASVDAGTNAGGAACPGCCWKLVGRFMSGCVGVELGRGEGDGRCWCWCDEGDCLECLEACLAACLTAMAAFIAGPGGIVGLGLWGVDG